jgi:hypothetical protein
METFKLALGIITIAVLSIFVISIVKQVIKIRKEKVSFKDMTKGASNATSIK